MHRIFEASPDFVHQDRSAFTLRHRLADHPALTLERLAATIPALDPGTVYFSARRMKTDEDFDNAVNADRDHGRVGQLIETMRHSDGYIMVREPERHPSFRDLHADLTAGIEQTIRDRGWGEKALFPRCYLFISSPNSVTPFHFDRASNFLLQIRGSKQVSVFKPWDDRVITPVEYERRGADEPAAVRWKPESAAFGTTYTCGPGDALHIPFAAGHHVRNGPDDLSVTLSIFFNHRRSRDQLQALRFNNRMRKLLMPLGLTPAPVGRLDTLDSCKSLINRAMERLKGVAMAPLTGSLPFLHEAMGVADLFPRVMA